MEILSAGEISLRLLASVVTGAIVGLERESRGRPAGFRTTILACTAAAIAMILSDILYREASIGVSGPGTWHPDPARLGAGILTGIGFLGAGTIIRHGSAVRGVTTAASLWFVTALGLAYGSGLFVLGMLGTSVALLTLFLLPRIEHLILSDYYYTVHVTVAGESPGEKELLALMRAHGLKPVGIKADWDFKEGLRDLTIEVRGKRRRRFDLCSDLMNALSKTPGVLRAHWS